MADIHIDIERMIMHSNYLLEVDNSSASNGLSDMERKQYLDQIKDLVQTVQTLLDANIALGNKQKELQAEADRKIAGLQEQVDKLTGELQVGFCPVFPLAVGQPALYDVQALASLGGYHQAEIPDGFHLIP